MFPRGHIMSALPNCPACNSEYTHEDGIQYVCPEGAHEWPQDAGSVAAADESASRGAHGTVLQGGDTGTAIKDLKTKCASQVVKGGTKVKNFRPVGGDH